MQPLRVIFLGTGDAFSAGGRNQAGYLIEGSGESLLLDCGATILTALNREHLSTGSIDTVFISHLHGDHFAGLPFLFLNCINIELRTRPLNIIGPPGVESRAMQLFGAMYADTAAEPMPFELGFVEAQPGKPSNFGGMQVTAFHVPHQEHPPSFGCAIETGGRKIVYSGDSGWTEELVAHAQNADLFICECSFFETRLATHLDYPQIAENLRRFGAKRIVLTHLGEEVLRRQKDLKIETAHDGLVVAL
jgi:ribonuclease BN (tRNA processing enzyme)